MSFSWCTFLSASEVIQQNPLNHTPTRLACDIHLNSSLGGASQYTYKSIELSTFPSPGTLSLFSSFVSHVSVSIMSPSLSISNPSWLQRKKDGCMLTCKRSKSIICQRKSTVRTSYRIIPLTSEVYHITGQI